MSNRDPSTRTTAQTITPLRITRNNQAIGEADLKRRHRFGILVLICAAAALVTGGVWWLRYLSKNPLPPQAVTPQPGSVKPAEAEKQTPAVPQAPPAPAADPTQTDLAKEEAEKKLAAFLEAKKELEKVAALIASGSRYEQNNALAEARDEYRKALQIDPDSKEARLALDRVAGLIREQQFRQLMSQGLAAFHRNDLTLARSRLQEATSLKPASSEASDALLQVDRAMRLARIDTLQGEAQAAAQSEDWQRALQSYLAVLDIDANVQFAVRGKKQALERIRLAERFQFFLGRPQVLESDQQLKNAVLLVNEAREIEPRGPQLNAQIKELEGLLSIAQTPVSVTIESDNLTQIAVYRVGKLGRFSEYELKLRPGTYTVVGARDGYQDVRQQIVVKPGPQSLRVTIKCRVKI